MDFLFPFAFSFPFPLPFPFPIPFPFFKSCAVVIGPDCDKEVTAADAVEEEGMRDVGDDGKGAGGFAASDDEDAV